MSTMVKNIIMGVLILALGLGTGLAAGIPKNPHSHFGTSVHYDCDMCQVMLNQFVAAVVSSTKVAAK